MKRPQDGQQERILRVESTEYIDAAKAAFGRMLADVGTVVDSARHGRFTFKNAGSDILHVLYWLHVDSPYGLRYATRSRWR